MVGGGRGSSDQQQAGFHTGPKRLQDMDDRDPGFTSRMGVACGSQVPTGFARVFGPNGREQGGAVAVTVALLLGEQKRANGRTATGDHDGHGEGDTKQRRRGHSAAR
jgi:hypothetical protein